MDWLGLRHAREWGSADVMVQAYLHRPNLVPYGHRIPMAPHYVLKIKSARGMAEVRVMKLTAAHICYSAKHQQLPVEHALKTAAGAIFTADICSHLPAILYYSPMHTPFP